MANLRAATAEEGRAQFFVYAQTMNILFGVTRAALEIHREGQAEKYMKSLYVIEGATADNGPAWNHGWIGWKDDSGVCSFFDPPTNALPSDFSQDLCNESGGNWDGSQCSY